MIGTMASKKKRPLAVEPEVTESACEKVRLNDGASTSYSIAPVAMGQTHHTNQSNVGELTFFAGLYIKNDMHIGFFFVIENALGLEMCI